MSEAKVLAQRPRRARFQRRRIRQAIREISQPRGEKERHDVSGLEGNAEGSGKEPKPRDSDERGVEANQVKPNGRDGALRRPRLNSEPTPQRDVPTQIGL